MVEIDARMHCVVEGDTPSVMSKSVGLAIIELSSLFELLNPDIVLTVADRHETIATAIAASYQNILLAHTQGGEITGSIDESVRHAITRLAHLHFPASDDAYHRLIRSGEEESTIYNFGCPALDTIYAQDLRLPRKFLSNLGGSGDKLVDGKPFLTVLLHPVTTEYEDAEKEIQELMTALESVNEQILWLWPNVDASSETISKKIRQFKENNKNPAKIRFLRNLQLKTTIG